MSPGRQILGAVAQLEKARLVAKLKQGRDRKQAVAGKTERRKRLKEIRPDTVTLARSLRRRKPKGGQLSSRDIACELAARGHMNERGRRFNPKSVQAMLR
jgi:DNA invertase Pin-like site-specific DNA recombinase